MRSSRSAKVRARVSRAPYDWPTSLYLTVVPHRRLFSALLLPYFMFFSVVIVFFVVVVGGGGGFTEKSEVAKSSSQSLFGSFYYLSIYFNSVPQNKYFLSAYGE